MMHFPLHQLTWSPELQTIDAYSSNQMVNRRSWLMKRKVYSESNQPGSMHSNVSPADISVGKATYWQKQLTPYTFVWSVICSHTHAAISLLNDTLWLPIDCFTCFSRYFVCNCVARWQHVKWTFANNLQVSHFIWESIRRLMKTLISLTEFTGVQANQLWEWIDETHWKLCYLKLGGPSSAGCATTLNKRMKIAGESEWFRSHCGSNLCHTVTMYDQIQLRFIINRNSCYKLSTNRTSNNSTEKEKCMKYISWWWNTVNS